MNLDSLVPLSAPTLPQPGTAVLVNSAGAPAPALAQLETAQRILSERFAALETAPDAPALVVATSGSTGTPKQTVLSASALAASARGTEASTRTHNAQWLLALPLHYVAGAQVIARSVLAGTRPVLTRSVAEGARFTAQDFLTATQRLTASDRLVSLVPTQLHRLLETPDTALRSETLAALRSYSAILLGGAPASADLIAATHNLQLPVVRTYGSAETAGGCIYEGVPLPGVRIYCQPEHGQGTPAPGSPGRIWLGGPTLATGYAGHSERTAAHFFVDGDGTRWYRTDDLGFLTANGALQVAGRADDVLISGGLKTSAAAVATALETHPAVREALVVGLPDAHWGQVITAAVTPVATASAPPHLTQELTELVAQTLGVASAPKLILVLDELPELPTGKPDRQAVRSLLRHRWGGYSTAPEHARTGKK